MKANGILRALFVTTSLSTVACGMEGQIYTQTPEHALLDPNRSFGKRALGNMVTDVRQGVAQDTQEFLSIARKAWNGEWASVAGVGVQEVIDQLNGQFLSRYNLERNPQTGQFDPDSFKPFLKAFREKATVLLQGWLARSGNSYAFNPKTGDQYPIFSNTPFQQLANYLIPDGVPMKGLIISICNAGPVNDYLANQLDELAINCFLNLYQRQTNEKFDQAQAASLIFGALRSGAATAHELATTDYADYKGPLPQLAQETAKYSPIFDYLKPHFDHLVRETLNSLFLDATQSVSALIIDQGVKATLENSLVANGMKGVALTLAGFGGAAGWTAGGVAGGFVGGLSGSYAGAGMGFGAGYKLAHALGGETLARLGGAAIGAPIGFAVGSVWGAAIGSWTGAATGAVAASAGTFAYAPRVMAHMTKSLAETAKQELNDQLKLLVDYHVHSFLPLTEDEHVLYHLNPTPTPEERAIYSHDYARREQLLGQSFAGEFIKQFIDLNNGYVASTLKGINDGYQLFIQYCLASEDATAEEILEKANLVSASSPEVEDGAKVWREFVVRTSGPSPLTEADKALKANLSQFPSFKVKQQYLGQLSLYMNSLSANDLQKFARNFKEISESATTEKGRIVKAGQAIGKAGERLAAIYESATRKPLDAKIKRQIQGSANGWLHTATPAQLDRLAAMLEDEQFTPDVQAIEKGSLEGALNDYVAKRDLAYLAQGDNQSRFEGLRQSSLTEGMAEADVVDLLRSINAVTVERLPEDVKSALTGRVSKEEMVAAAEQQELALIKGKYESLLGTQLTVFCLRAFNDRFEGMAHEIGGKILEMEPSLSKDQLFEKIQSELFNRESVDQFMGCIFGHPQSALFAQKVFSEIKGQIMGVAEDLVGQKMSEKEGKNEQAIPTLPSSESLSPSSSYLGFPWIWGSGSSSPDVARSEEKTSTVGSEGFAINIDQLKLYDPYDIGGAKLIDIINTTLKKEKLGALQGNDFETIYAVIQKNKENALKTENDLLFLKNHKGEILAFKMSQKSLANKLFYGYTEVIQAIREQNQQILDSIQNLKQ